MQPLSSGSNNAVEPDPTVIAAPSNDATLIGIAAAGWAVACLLIIVLVVCFLVRGRRRANGSPTEHYDDATSMRDTPERMSVVSPSTYGDLRLTNANGSMESTASAGSAGGSSAQSHYHSGGLYLNKGMLHGNES
jgi:hypothetical protein